jgi:hypothetical protein
VANSHWFEDVMAEDVAQWERSLSPEEVAAARERGRALDLWQTAQELLDDWLPMTATQADGDAA